MALQADIVQIFNNMKQKAQDDPDNAYDDAYMCENIAAKIKGVCDNVTVTCNSLLGSISAGTISSITPAVATKWTIDDSKLENDLKNAFSNSVDSSGNASKTSADMANGVASAIKDAIEGGSCQWSTITIICVPPVTPPPTVTVVGGGKGEFQASAGAGTCAATILNAFNITVSEGTPSGNDTSIAAGIATAVLSYLNGMQIKVTGTGAAAGATGQGVAAGAV